MMIIGQHRSRPTAYVAWFVGLSVGLSVCHSSEPCKTAEPIEMPYGLRTLVSQRNHVLDRRKLRGNF